MYAICILYVIEMTSLCLCYDAPQQKKHVQRRQQRTAPGPTCGPHPFGPTLGWIHLWHILQRWSDMPDMQSIMWLVASLWFTELFETALPGSYGRLSAPQAAWCNQGAIFLITSRRECVIAPSPSRDLHFPGRFLQILCSFKFHFTNECEFLWKCWKCSIPPDPMIYHGLSLFFIFTKMAPCKSM